MRKQEQNKTLKRVTCLEKDIHAPPFLDVVALFAVGFHEWSDMPSDPTGFVSSLCYFTNKFSLL